MKLINKTKYKLPKTYEIGLLWKKDCLKEFEVISTNYKCEYIYLDNNITLKPYFMFYLTENEYNIDNFINIVTNNSNSNKFKHNFDNNVFHGFNNVFIEKRYESGIKLNKK